jgi:hypothetical protein
LLFLISTYVLSHSSSRIPLLTPLPSQITEFLIAKGYSCVEQGELDYVFARPYLPAMAAVARPHQYVNVTALLNRKE